MKLQLDQIRTDGGTQPRGHISEDVCREYVDALLHGDTFPPVVVFHDGENYWLADGFHRVTAVATLKWDEIEADVRQGTLRDAVLHSVGANAAHGYRRSNDDKRRSVKRLLDDAEWAALSDREVARLCRVTHPFVSSLRPKLSGNRYQIDPKSADTSNTQPRKVRRGGQVYDMQTARIGRPETPPAAPQQPPFPPAHLPIAGKIAYAMTMLGPEIRKITAAQMARAMFNDQYAEDRSTLSRRELREMTQRLIPWLEEFLKETTNNAA